MTKSPFRDPLFGLTCLCYLAITWGPISGITVWYDEAWRLVIAVKDNPISRWFIEGRPIPVSIPHLMFIRIVHGGLGWPASEWVLRYSNVLVAFGVFYLVWVFTVRATGERLAAFGATVLLASNAYFGFQVVGIKEHVWLVLILGLWALRLQRLISSGSATGFTDAAICAGAMLFSPLSANAIAVIVPVLLVFRGWKQDLKLFFAGVLPSAIYGALQIDAVRIYEERFRQFTDAHGVTAPPLFGATMSFSVADFLLLLGGVPFLGVIKLAGIVLWIGVIGAAIFSRRPKLIAAFAIPPAVVLFFQLTTGLAEPRMMLWLAPVFAILAAITLRRYPAAIVILGLLSATGWISVWQRYPEKYRFDQLALSNGFDSRTDVVLHSEGLIYFPHEVFDPGAPKGVFPLPEKGIDGLVLHPDLDFGGRQEIPREMLWDDDRLRDWKGGAVWAVTSNGFQEGLITRMQNNLFAGQNRTDTFVDEPYYWVRVRPSS